MPSKSKSQQRFFGMVDAYKKGELKNPGSKVKKAAEGMSMDDVKDFAETKHKGLPEKVEENMNKQIIRMTESDLHQLIKESVQRILEDWNGDRFEYENFTDEGNGGAEEYGVNIAKLVNGLGGDPDSIHAVAEEAAQHMDKEKVLKPFIEGLIAIYKSGENLLNPSPQDIYDQHGIVRN